MYIYNSEITQAKKHIFFLNLDKPKDVIDPP